MNKLPQKPLGDTGIHVSALGLGTVKFGRNEGVKYPSTFEIPDDAFINEFLSRAHALGINFLDTAPAYGDAEVKLGRLLPGKRDDWVLETKVGETFEQGESSFNFRPEFIQQSVEQSLKRLNTDYLDIVLVHSDGNDLEIINSYEVFDTLLTLKNKGLLRAFGMSTKTIEGGLATIEHADAAMITYNPIDTKNKVVIERAAELNKAIVIKKALASGHLHKLPGDNPVQSVMDFIFEEPGVTSVVAGTINPAHLQTAVDAVSQQQIRSS